MSRKCVMGCPKVENLHRFPKDPTRRAEWLRILCVKSSVKRLYACSRHFSGEFIFGNKISKFAVPKNERAEVNVLEVSDSILFNPTQVPILGESPMENNMELGNSGDMDIRTIDYTTENRVGSSIDSDMIVEYENSDIEGQEEDIGDIDFNEGDINTINSDLKTDSSSKLRTLRTALDNYRGRYLAERRMNTKLRADNVRLSKQLDNYKEKVEKLEFELKKKNDMSSKISNSLSVCLENSLINHSREAKNRRYSIGLKLIALAVYFLSPLVYRYLCTLLDWPQVRTLQRFVKDWPKTPGNLNGTFEALKVRARDFSEEEKYVSVSCDEMSLKSFLDYDRYKDKIIGLQDFGDENRSRNIATSAMVIMASGIGGNSWSQAVSYFFIHGSCKGKVMKKYIFEAISKLQAIGLKPCQFVCDQGANFVNFSKVVEVSQQRPYFEVNKQRVFFMHDTPHLLKSARNCLLNTDHKVYFNNKLVSWKAVIHFYNVDSNSVKCAPKLSMEHIYPNNFQRMRVNLAAHVLSRTVATGMRTLQASGKLDPSKSSTFLNTADYLEFFNNLFDLFNSRAQRDVFNCSVEQLEFLRQASKKLQTIQIVDEKGANITNTFKFISGWLNNISALKSLWPYLNQEGFQGLKTRRLTQDHLEHFFGQIRKGSGNSNYTS